MSCPFVFETCDAWLQLQRFSVVACGICELFWQVHESVFPESVQFVHVFV